MRSFIAAACLLAAFAAAAAPASAQAGTGIAVPPGGPTQFYLSIGSYFHVSERQVLVLHGTGVRDEDLPVAFYVASRAHVPPEAVVDLRLHGASWMDITLHYGLSPAIYYYVAGGDACGPPYAKAYEHFRKHKRKDWRTVRLDDADVVNLVNLRFVSQHHGLSAREVMKQRAAGRSFLAITDEAVRHRREWADRRRHRPRPVPDDR
jgi:hypothetical protein